MRFLQNIFNKTPQILEGIVAISFLTAGFSIAVTRYNENNRPHLLFCAFIDLPQQQWSTTLKEIIANYRLENYACHVLLNPDQYRSFGTEALKVDQHEMRQAVRWRIADILDYPVEQAFIDYYPLPKSNRANSTPMIEVISGNQSVINPFVQICQQAGLKVAVVEIQEMALRNLATLLPESERGVAVLNLQPTSGHIIIQQAGILYLSRRFDMGYNRLIDNSFDSEPQILMEQDTLALEIQRSLDYVENYYGIPPISSLAVLLVPHRTESIVSNLMTRHGITARALDLSAIVEGEMILTDALQNACAPVIGASLRRLIEGVV
ncbi:hypothetical protein A1359_15175 [Methylomonas lenta]|uniref:MSHA biogenesis protein MshI n=1 Tax=Methylomonas lenta TaxID=980561 RepID=A0A177MZ98_9GAMM|nr:hypothetical protein [Methylomonas lenta]OAI11037.1 hypothetical protein A1359_15175 [Methylomonas lenta]